MRPALRLTITALSAGAIVLMVPSAGNAALPPNHSIFFYKAGFGAVTGTLTDGIYNQVENQFDVDSGWTAAAVSRDTLVLFNASSQEMGLATLTAGTYVAKAPVFFAGSHFTKVTASCDSVLFYDPSGGKSAAIHLTAGQLDTKHAHTYTLGKNFTSVDASCNTVSLLNNKGIGIIGTLKNGAFVKKGALKTDITNPMVAHTATSFVRYSRSTHKLEWGPSSNGVEHVTGGPVVYLNALTNLAGTNTSALLYDGATGNSTIEQLVNGQATNVQAKPFSPGWQVIAGGR